MTEYENDERPRGVLSPADRKYLRAPGEYSRQATHEREKKIRERVRNSILDFQLLSETMDGDDRDRVLDLDEHWYEVDYALPYMIAFVHNVVADHYDNPKLEPQAGGQGHKNRFFEIRLQDGLYQAYLEHNVLIDDVELDVTSQKVPGISEVRERVEEGHPVDVNMIQYLLTTGEVSGEDLEKFLADQLDVDRADDEE